MRLAAAQTEQGERTSNNRNAGSTAHHHIPARATPASHAASSMEPPTFLHTALHRNWAFHVVKYLAPHDAGRLEQCLARDSVFVEAAVTPLLRMVAGRMQAAAEKAGATMLVPLGEERGGRVTWAKELLWIYVAMARIQVGAKKMTSAGLNHSLMTSGNEGRTWSCGRGAYVGHVHVPRTYSSDPVDVYVPRLIEALNRVAVVQVAAGEEHSMALAHDGSVFGWGVFKGTAEAAAPRGADASLTATRAKKAAAMVPKQVEDLTDVTYIACGGAHSIAVGGGGAVYTWGNNQQGQLGLGDNGWSERNLVPNTVPDVNGVIAVAAGFGHSLVLRRDGTIMASGKNNAGQLGLGDTERRNTFTDVPNLWGVVDIDGGSVHSIAVTVLGDVFTWGYGWAMGQGGRGLIFPSQYLVPTKVIGGGIEDARMVQVAVGSMHSMALTASGILYTWGKGESGQLGHGRRGDLAVPSVVGGIGGAVVGVAGGLYHSLVTTGDGRVLVFGATGSGALGLGAGPQEPWQEALTPTAIDGITLGNEGEEGKVSTESG